MTNEWRCNQLVDAAREAERLGLNSGSSGNFSVRVADSMLISPTGIPSAELRPEMCVTCAFDGSFSGRWRPSSEWELHAEIYKAYPHATAVLHAHPDNCVALSCLREPLPAFHYMVASFGGNDVPCARYETFGSRELALATVEALLNRTACLLANHGMVCFDEDIGRVVAKAAKLELLARQYMMARACGSPVILDDVEIARVAQRYRTYGQQPVARDDPTP